ncbi:MAG: P1 family peptidase [candidate division Zixibacteria bacterium]|nr:P1 family peptidase [candidate division Zixibacteria bacterium]
MDRRGFLTGMAGVAALAGLGARSDCAEAVEDYGPAGSVTEVEGIKVGHFTDTRKPTGCTVIVAEAGAVGGVDVRGGAPGTRETDLLDPVNLVDKVHAVVLSGGSAFGLDTATGVMKYLEERDIGFDVRIAKVPIVPAAILFDLSVGDPKIRPDAEAGYRACAAASTGPVAEGSVGAGAGATVGKALGRGAMKGGIGNACLTMPDGLKVGAIVAVNAVGDIYDPRTGKILAGARTPDGKAFVNIAEHVRRKGSFQLDPIPQNTTIGAIVTNALLTKTEANRVAQVGHDGLARAINPAHLQTDGDTLFTLATGALDRPANLSVLCILAAAAVSEAIVRAVVTATSIPGYPSYREIMKK